MVRIFIKEVVREGEKSFSDSLSITMFLAKYMGFEVICYRKLKSRYNVEWLKLYKIKEIL